MTIVAVSENPEIQARVSAVVDPLPTDAVRLQVVTTDHPFPSASVHERLFVTDGDETELDRLADLTSMRRRITPTRAEFAMHAAYGAALRSAGLRGGVGAALADAQGDVIALGTAEVPVAGGGQYWEGDSHDARDVVFGFDPASAVRAATVEALLDLLPGMGVRLPTEPGELVGELLKAFDSGQRSNGVGHGGTPAQSFESLGRVVHAEMAAMLSAARSGVRVAGLTMYVTAQPCRQCLRHLVCAGLDEVVYLGPALVEPVPFHADSVTTCADELGKLRLVPFTGVGPGAYQLVFAEQMRAGPDPAGA